ncbi:MAG: 50S ribosomal protein L10 [Candidatus Paceibacterota bacterium]
MKTKAQKKTQIEAAVKELKGKETVIITDFTGLSANELNAFRKSVRSIGGKVAVIKKRLLKFVFEKEGIDFDPKQFGGQAGVVFSPKDMVETAGVVYKFSKLKDLLKISGGFEMGEKKFMSATDVKRMGQLPPKEVLLGQLAYMLGAPIRSFMFVIKEKAKKSN